MKALAIALLLVSTLGAQAASPEDAYLASRDKAIAKFKDVREVTDSVTKQEEAARADLEKMLRGLLGKVSVTGMPDEGKSNLESLITGDMGFGQLDGLVYQENDDGPRLLVTTPALAKRWLTAHKKWWDKDNVPQELNAALKSDSFYTQAVNNDAAASHFADIPLTKPASAGFVTAMLIARGQDNGPGPPTELVLSIVRADRVFVWSTNVKGVTAIAACEEFWTEGEKKSEALQEKYRKSELKDEKAFEESTRATDEGFAAMRECYGERTKDQPYFADVIKQAQDLVDRLK